MNNTPLYVYFGHHKCASTWISNICRSACQRLNMRYSIASDEETLGKGIREYADSHGVDFVGYSNALFSRVEELDSFKGFHVVRDPRDIVISAFFSHLNSHPSDHWPELEAYRSRLKQVSREEGLLIEMDHLSQQFDSMYQWNYQHPEILELRMEDLTQAPFEGFMDIFASLGLLDDEAWPDGWSLHRQIGNIVAALRQRGLLWGQSTRLPIEVLLYIVYENRFSKLSKGRKAGEENTASHYRKGLSGDWRNHFTDVHKRWFKENYNQLLVKLDYEQGDDW